MTTLIRFLTLLFALFPVTADAQLWESRTISISDSTCIMVLQGKYENTRVQGLTCPVEAGKSFALRYVWLNAGQISFLLAKYSDENMAPILGARPTVALNLVFERLTSIYGKYGTRGSDNFPEMIHISGPGRTSGLESTLDEEQRIPIAVPIGNLPISLRTKFKLPTFEGPIIWPDLDLVPELSAGNGWPERYRYYYDDEAEFGEGAFLRQLERGARRKRADVADRLAQCMTMHRYLSEVEFKNYWSLIDDLETELLEEKTQLWLVEPNFQSDEPMELIIDQIVSNEAYDMHADVSSEYWPPDYMLLRGTIENGSEAHCFGESGGISVRAEPRSLHAVVAVITPLAEEVVVKSAPVQVDKRTALRAELVFDDDEELPFGDVVLNKSEGDSLIIPLWLELRYDDDESPFNSSFPTPNKVEGILRKYPDSPVNFARCVPSDDGQVNCTPFIETTMGEFPSHSSAKVTPKYYTGPAYRLDNLNINGEMIGVRDVPTLALVADVFGEQGSCPFLYFEHHDGSVSYHGRVLVGANGPQNIRSESIPLPAGVRRILIREKEPELTYLTGISFDGHSTASVISAGTVRLGPRDQLSVVVPSGSENVTITGYYELLD